MLLLAIRFCGLDHIEKWRLKRWIPLLIIGFLAYSLTLLYLYISGDFAPDEALRLASMQRYLATWLTGMLIFALAVWRQGIESSRSRAFAVLASVVLIAGIGCFIPPWFHSSLFAEHYYADAQKDRAVQRAAMEQLKSENNLDPGTDRVWIANESTDTVTFFYLAYRMLPVPVNSFYDTNVSGPSTDSTTIPFAWDTTPDVWSDILRSSGYTHLYLENLTPLFKKDFAIMFRDPAQISDHTLYRIEYDGNNARFIAN
jgi:hypothetical protein